ncbi:hypothetical protein JX265_008882 [Neoarthrinium moseri]|uniref:Uncharacterized protein n=1 Tax=Neoarthrinium moseri TaxID=1658444 RepID=A0A9P9WHF5_9PEZI|nr:uncharacterized protein JN550_013712 [Neoarthrinium moseri]KAI1856673.1 hypothetical protein JN550_013712 [Neoarthrinium moseri]KAI1863665.1 hypothetical protein JX265_008882 [Neoarthrinium moseri]
MACNILEPTRGASLSFLAEHLTGTERRSIEFQKGQLLRRISSFKSPNSRFGPVVAVISSSTASSDPGAAEEASSAGPGGAHSWMNAFLTLVEGVLRDGEDLAVMMSYSLIRHHVHRLSHLLDAVTQARLVVLDAGSNSNVLVSRSTKPGDQEGDKPVPRRPGKEEGEVTGKAEKTGEIKEMTKENASKSMGSPGFSVRGLRDWSNCIFGDPLMTAAFNEAPSPELLRGFGYSNIPALDDDDNTSSLPPPTTSTPTPIDDMIEDPENADIRLLLYECYHAAVGVVRQFYRPAGTDGTRREMAARRRLATVLNRLAEVDENAGKRPRTASIDIWPMKKPKSDNGADEDP